MKLKPLILAMLLTGCSTTPINVVPPTPVAADFIRWSSSLSVDQRWPVLFEVKYHVRPLVVICHGGDDTGHWWMYPDAPMKPMLVESVVQTLKATYPGRYIMLITCNPGHRELKVSGVFYNRTRDGVWDQPGPSHNFDNVTKRWRDLAGSIDDFEEGKP